ncbi:DoxX family protein [Methylocystis sp. MJC1]|uniref:DoxX family protein n=1 Tax=Methylocystis sp. MJC1 TaxID=2654282 RepID=UPI0013ED6B71|nr:DoxX family protein [Methylocystis sp. MJC1]KAF2990217.1 putative oxidoreductase CatD [Methylocystis sp. MJC1]MBU6528086.1 DoxX family protein [Methylocystis sp. MJC1]UZX11003.1 DoxX family protein [Methylocystis sp. MJC1]
MSFSRTAPYGAMLLRLSLGVLFLAHGLLKVLVFTLPGTAAFFGTLGYPPALAYVVVGLEIVGGLMLLAGLFTRVVSLALAPLLIGALLVHLPNGWRFSAANGGWEFPALWIVLLFAQALLGPGAFALRLPRALSSSANPVSI